MGLLDKYLKTLPDVPGSFFRGTVPGETKRINEPFSEGSGMTFMARKRDSAQNYGDEIERIEAHPDAKILFQESPEFWKLIQRRRPANNSLGSVPGGYITNVNEAIRRAKEAGYDAVSFLPDADVGTVMLNPDKFIRGLKGLMAPAAVGATLYSPEAAQAMQRRNMAEQQALEPATNPFEYLIPSKWGGGLMSMGMDAAMNYFGGK